MHNLLEMQKLYGKLHHTTMVLPAGRAYLTGLEAMLATCSNRPFLPRSPPRDTPDDLEWWKSQLRGAPLSRIVLKPQQLINYKAYSDASSGFSVAITIGPRWRAWRLAAGWKAQGRDIQWAEAVGFKLLTIHVRVLSKEGEHVKVHGDNHGVIKGWWKGCSGNQPTNIVLQNDVWTLTTWL